ncbi:TetR/AcrR family transcriptional regulator [Burkholderia contaminans]|nr:TetR/AcrR family transcriptional regulator [Burkholderia contaminans]
MHAALRIEAERILRTRGVSEVSLREVARGVGVSHAAPYRHYAGREALLVDLATRGFERLHACFDSLPQRADPERRLGDLLGAYLAFATNEPATYRLMFGPELRKEDHPELAKAGFAVLDVLRRAMVALDVPAPATAETMLARGLSHGLALLLLDQRIEFEAGVDEEMDQAAIVHEATAIILAGLRSRVAAKAKAPVRRKRRD